MSETRIGIIMNGVTGRMGLNQHLVRSILAIRAEGGLALADGSRLMPDPILVGRSAAKLEQIAKAHGVLRWTTNLDAALANPNDAIYFDAQVTGMRVASVGGGSHFAEGASGLAASFAVSGKTTQYNSVQPYVLVEGKQNFYTASGVTLTPDAEIGYEYEAGTHGVVTTLTGADGTVFYTPHNDLDPSDALLSAGIAASKNNWSLFATYTAHVSGNWDTQIGEAGLRITF